MPSSLLFLAAVFSGLAPANLARQLVPRTLATSTSVSDPIAVLEESKDPEALVAAAEVLCEAADVVGVDQLVSMLLKPSLQGRLDSEDDYARRPYSNLRVTQVLLAMARLPDNLAEAELGRCARDPCFMRHPKRVDALIYAAGEIHKPSPYVLRFIDERGTPDNGSTTVVKALARIATEESCALIEKRVLSPDYDAYDKSGWLHDILITVRDRPAIVATYKRLIASDIKENRVREALVQTLFDYRPLDWYGTEYHRQYQPPPWKRCSTAVLTELLDVADAAEKLDVSDEAKAGVAKARKVIVAVLASRERRAARRPPPPDVTAPLAILREAKEPDVLVVAAEEVCDSQNADAIEQLTSLLLDPSFQARLDPAQGRQSTSFLDMRITQVLTAVARLPVITAEAQLARCARDSDFMRSQYRAAAFVYAAAEVQEPSALLLRLVDEQGCPEHLSSAVVQSLARMATDESCALIEKRLLSKNYDANEKVDWLEEALSRVRDRPAVLAMYRRLLGAKIAEREVREALVQTLFEYHLDEWYGSWCPRDAGPPRWVDCSTSVLEELLHIADIADKLDVSDEAKASVAKARERIGSVLVTRKEVKHPRQP